MAKRLSRANKPAIAPPKPLDERTTRTTGIALPADMWAFLNRIAFERARKYGGRPSVSALLRDLVERHRKELEGELKGIADGTALRDH